MQGKQLEKKKIGQRFLGDAFCHNSPDTADRRDLVVYGRQKVLHSQRSDNDIFHNSVFAGFESRKPQARELVTLAVMCAMAVALEGGFIWAPNF